MEFSGKVALITGGVAASAAPPRLASQARCQGSGGRSPRSRCRGERRTCASAWRRCLRRPGHVTKSGDVQNYVKATLDAYGAIDCLFNNAGIEGKVMPMQDYDEADFDAVIAVNLKGVFLGMRHVLPVMLKQRHGAIVNTSSTAGLFGGPGIAPYVASKHAVLGLTKVASADVARLRVRVNAVCPGLVETRMMRSLEAQINPAHPVAVHDAYSGSIPTGRYATPEEVANVVM